MSNIFTLPKISSYEELIKERQKLELLLEQQKNRVRIGVDELRQEFKDKMKPAADVASFIQKIAAPETRKKTAWDIGANFTIDFVTRKLFSKSVIMQLLVSPVVKSYAQRLIAGMSNNQKFK